MPNLGTSPPIGENSAQSSPLGTEIRPNINPVRLYSMILITLIIESVSMTIRGLEPKVTDNMNNNVTTASIQYLSIC